jgi:hypothetical protein
MKIGKRVFLRYIGRLSIRGEENRGDDWSRKKSRRIEK